MATRWRKAFCTSVPGDIPDTPCSPPASSFPPLRCRTKPSSSSSPTPTTPCSSPSRLALLKLRLCRSCCGVCLKTAKTGQGTAVFTAECSHSFHFSCIAASVKRRGALVCPVCAAHWRPVPLLSDALRYDDDEPLLTPRYTAIPEEEEDEKDCLESNAKKLGGVEVILFPTVVSLASVLSHNKHVIYMKLKAPLALYRFRRTPIDLVAVLDVGSGMTGAKAIMMKQAIRLVVSSLSSTDRLAIIGAAVSAHRLLPLTRMTPRGQRSARRILDGLHVSDNGNSVGDALRKATKLLQDRRDCNPVASIMLLSDGTKHLPPPPPPPPPPVQRSAYGTRFAHVEIPVSDEEACGGDALAKCVGGLLSVVVHDVRLQLSFSPGEVTGVYASGAQPEAVGVAGESIRVGDLYAEEEREFLVEVTAPAELGGRRASLKVRCCYREPGVVESSPPVEQAFVVSLSDHHEPPSAVERLRNLYVRTRATVEARRLAELGDFRTALHLLASAKALLARSTCASGKEDLEVVEEVEAEVRAKSEERRRMGPREPLTPSLRRASEGFPAEEDEALTPTSAWRAAERLARVAVMRKTMNRISDLHGFENARF